MKIGLGIIVKNEEKDLPACLDSFLPHVDFACIIDTGSKDRTLDIAGEYCAKHLPVGSFLIETFVGCNDELGRIKDFSAARNEYIRVLESFGADYIMSADADDTLETPTIRDMIEMQPADFYFVRYRMDEDTFFNSPKIWAAGYGVKYAGKVHETIPVNYKKILVYLDAEYLHHWTAPAEGMETSTERNMRILKAEIYPPLRSLFYYANECIQSKQYDEGVKWYLEYIRRSDAGEGSWFVEYAHCHWRAARWLQYLGNTDMAINISKKLLKADSSWSESWCELAYISSIKGDIKAMREYAKKASKNKWTPRLFSEKDKYTTVPAMYLAMKKG